MARMKYFGRWINQSSDDMWTPAISSLVWRLPWLVMLCYTIPMASNPACTSGITSYLGVAVGWSGVGLLLDCTIIVLSFRGTIADEKPRRAMGPLLHVRFFESIGSLALAAIGVAAFLNVSYLPIQACMAVDGSGQVSQNAFFTLTAALLALQCCHAAVSICSWLCGRRKSQLIHDLSNKQSINAALDRSTRRWRRILGCASTTFCCGGCTDNSIVPMASVDLLDLAAMGIASLRLQEEALNLTMSDITAGLILLKQKQRSAASSTATTPPHINDSSMQIFATATYNAAGADVVSGADTVVASEVELGIGKDVPDRVNFLPAARQRELRQHGNTLLDHNNAEEVRVLQECSYYMGYALGQYGAPCYAYTHCPSCCATLPLLACSSPCLTCQEGDACGCGGLAFRATVMENSRRQAQGGVGGAEQAVRWEHIAHVSFRNELFAVPYSVTADVTKRCVVVSIRGTMSFTDAFVDILATPISVAAQMQGRLAEYAALNCQLEARDLVVHPGIWKVATLLAEQLRSGNFLNAAYSTLGGRDGAGLVITGHSLGAGTASLLSLMLLPDFPNLRCFAFAPPAATMSVEMAAQMHPWITSIVIGDDCVPRLSLRSCRALMHDAVHCLATASISKPRLLISDACCGGSVPPMYNYGTSASDVLLSTTSGGFASPLHREAASLHETLELPDEPISVDAPQSGAGAVPAPPLVPTAMPHTHAMCIPGNILHIVRERTDFNIMATLCSLCFPWCTGIATILARLLCCCCTRRSRFTATWANPQKFDQLVVGADMVNDHFPDLNMLALRAALEPKN